MPQPKRFRQHRIVYSNGAIFPRDGKLLFKSEAVFYVLRAYAPQHTYAEVQNLFGGTRNADFTGRGYQNDCIMIENEVPMNKQNRFNMDRPITTADGVRFVVNTNWGEPVLGDRDCWRVFQDAAKEAGYTIETL